LVGFASAEIESSISAGYNSQYVYRGVDLGDDQAHLSLAASGNAGDLDWNIGLFHGSSEGADILGVAGSLDETRIHGGVSKGLSGIDLSATAFFNESDNYTGDTYYEISASKSVDVAENVTGTLAVTYGNWNKDPLGAGVSDVDFVSVSGTLNIDLGENVGASVGVTHISSDTAITEDETVVGTSLTLGF
jgi:hypothetical protein